MTPLLLRPVVLRSRRRRQGVQHRLHRGGTLRGKVAVQHPGTAQRGHQPQRPVLKRVFLVPVRLPGPGPLVHLREQPGQIRQPQPADRGVSQDLVRVPRRSSGSLSVHRHTVRATDSGISRPQPASDQGMRLGPPDPCGVPAAAPLVTPVLWTSQARGL